MSVAVVEGVFRATFCNIFSFILKSFCRLDSFLDGTVRQKNIGTHYWSIMKILRIPERFVIEYIGFDFFCGEIS